MTFDDFSMQKILKDITSAGSRNLVTYKLNKYDIKIADYAAYKQEGKQNQLVFVGKLMTVEGVKAPKGRVLIYRRPSAEAIKEAVGPTEVEDSRSHLKIVICLFTPSKKKIKNS